jgi:hypothetical protein
MCLGGNFFHPDAFLNAVFFNRPGSPFSCKEERMVSKIISGGQTGVDRAALDMAIKHGIPHGGWVPRGRKAEDGILPRKYSVRETSGYSYSRRTERNVLEADGTLILSRGKLKGGSLLTRQMALKHGRPWLHVDLEKRSAFEAALNVHEWSTRERIGVLNVAGPRASEDREIYILASRILETLFFLREVGRSLPAPSPDGDPFHPTHAIDDAVDRLIEELSLRDRIELAHMTKEQLLILYPALGEYIRNKFGLKGVSRKSMGIGLLESQGEPLHKGDVSALILVALWKRLRETHRLRVIK